ncbi:hypothetical protein NC652_001826 [Populus alba x Populus x berolinensis]|nr:hypothetical protein NC652_001826 [Populus alba x Populus x berolinensis]
MLQWTGRLLHAEEGAERGCRCCKKMLFTAEIMVAVLVCEQAAVAGEEEVTGGQERRVN